ncbi:MAG: transcriptional repressor [Muribaculaceae bacterium]|nr:transcriptional repressor [Muribaculaceae bacterium]
MGDEQALEQAGVRITAVRMLVWRTLRDECRGAFTLADLESLLPTVDRSTLFRTLVTLTEAHLLHHIDDGSGKQKYCVCHVDDTRQCMGHVHLTCDVCHRTFCLEQVPIPPVMLPAGFQPHETEYIIRGVCAACAAHSRPQP